MGFKANLSAKGREEWKTAHSDPEAGAATEPMPVAVK